ncbi:MAG TPA: hypothetical protein VLB27_05445, partial [candidate division Zixibacteria bacterium]|nr:hypothetical protein [candidate division Zixibacteria bacterium]
MNPRPPSPAPPAGVGNVIINSAAELKPDKRMVASQGAVNRFFFADCLTRDGNSGMWLLDSLGDTIQHVSPRPGSASWASDNLRAVCVDPRFRLKVLALHAPGKSLIIQTPDYIRPETPAWAPGRELIAFQSPDSSGVRQIFLVEPTRDGTGLRKLTQDTTNCAFPSWSPDGQRVLFN